MSLTDDSRALADLIDKRLDGDAGSGVGDYLAGAIMGWLMNNGWTKTGSADPCPGCQSGEPHMCGEGGKR